MHWVYQATLNQNPNRVLMPGIPTGPNAAVRLEQINESIALSRVPIKDYLNNLLHPTRSKKTWSQYAPRSSCPGVELFGMFRCPNPLLNMFFPWFPYRDAQKEWAKENLVDIKFS